MKVACGCQTCSQHSSTSCRMRNLRDNWLITCRRSFAGATDSCCCNAQHCQHHCGAVSRARHSFSHVFQLQADRTGVLLVARVCINRSGQGKGSLGNVLCWDPCGSMPPYKSCDGTLAENPRSPRNDKRPTRPELVTILALGDV